MKATIGRVACITVLLLVVTAVSMPCAALELVRLTPDDLKWTATPYGTYIAKLIGDDKTAGMYVIRYRFPANFRVPPHFHPDDRLVVVLSGTLHVGYGKRFDESTLKALPAGSIWTEPAEHPHFTWAKDGEVIIQVVGNGPSFLSPVQ